ncbi:MAG: hypothetical protein LBS19_05500 [Clostridiales bacterium]|jgi:hypothetical protein|nr:hypothetical protein [Clostridiales bacterium]
MYISPYSAKSFILNYTKRQNADPQRRTPAQTLSGSGAKELPVIPIDKSLSNNIFTEPTKIYGKNSNGISYEALSDMYAERLIENGFQYGESTVEKKVDIVNTMAFIDAVKRTRVPLKAKELDGLFKENGITFEEGEKYSIKVDTACYIKVSGPDEDKAAKMEDILNNTDFMGYSLNKLTNMYSNRYKVKPGEEYDRSIIHEMDCESQLRQLSGGTLSLRDLSLKNGRIIGLTPEIEALYNGTKPGMSDDEKHLYKMFRDMTKSVLKRGIDNIPDLTTDAVYEQGKLVFN